MAEQVGNSGGEVQTGYVAPIGVSSGSSSSTPSWFSQMNWGEIGNQIVGSIGGSIGTAIGSAVGGSDNKYASILGGAGAMVGSRIVGNLISGQKAFSGININSLKGVGYNLAGNLIGDAIGGDVGRAIGTGISNIGTISSSIKGIKQAAAASKAAKAASTAGSVAKASKLAMASNVANLAGVGASIASEFMPTKTEYAGKKGGITQGMDAAYDLISTGVSFIPGVGTIVGAGMQGLKLLGQGVNALGGGTDGMTTADAILGSSFFNWTPAGMINGFFGKTTKTIDKDTEAFQTVGSSYGGTEKKVDEAVAKSDKKYGLVSGSARRKADRLITRANVEQGRLVDIADEAAVDRMTAQTMSRENAYNVQNQLQGGLDYYGIRAGKKGTKLTLSEKRKRAKRIYEQVRAEEVAGFKEGGKVEQTPTWESVWVPVWEEEFVVKFSEGGKLESKNLIPEGALHARLHHMDQEGITKKGIPVITEENGEIIQHAEIECNEIIFRLEVTKKLEELAKSGTEEDALEAGKLLVKEILENTDDRTNLIDTV